MTIKWGDPIECNGVRPDWLRDGTPCAIDQGQGLLDNDWPAEEWSWWCGILAFYLPADHPAYVALARGFTPWSGGERAPDDWDGGTVLLRGGIKECPGPLVRNWSDDLGISTIIGYRKRFDEPHLARIEVEGVFIPRMTEAEARDLHSRVTRSMGSSGFRDSKWADCTVAILRDLGLVQDESRAERFTRETGHAVTEAVEAALNWKGE